MFNVIILVFGLISSINSMNITDFFPNAKGHTWNITWAHAVNNLTYLQRSLIDSKIMMLEADIVIGKLNNTGDDIPIMGHPPANTSDLSLMDFMDKVLKHNNQNAHNRKGIKLDFKSTDAFNKSMGILSNFTKIQCPLWLNADIVAGPDNAAPPTVNASDFLQIASNFSESTVLSLGWTTTTSKNSSKYTTDQIENMIKTIKNNAVKQEITFAVRAGTAAQSINEMLKLKKDINNSSLTIWQSSDSDYVNITNLNSLIAQFGENQVFIDVPKKIYDQINITKHSHSSVATIKSGLMVILTTLLIIMLI